MNEETNETHESQVSREESHPWLSGLTWPEEDDSLDEAIRFSLDELRLA